MLSTEHWQVLHSWLSFYLHCTSNLGVKLILYYFNTGRWGWPGDGNTFVVEESQRDRSHFHISRNFTVAFHFQRYAQNFDINLFILPEFSIPLPGMFLAHQAQESFSDRLLFVVRLLTFHIFDFFSSTTLPVSIRLGTNHPWQKGI
jgi:hypothetical protein